MLLLDLRYRRLTNVLEQLAACEDMLVDGHAVLVAETAVRRIHFMGLLMPETSPEFEGALRAILRLLSNLLQQ